ncbi:substrate-binding domain-containing protein [Clostridium polynesiense]|uniref:substrate-binding domain-containing protein n=1 Tax=Clostridium polynesiense TaxID=1325933 RepID=UPI00058E647B
MKKLILSALAIPLMVTVMTACGGEKNRSIAVVSREEGSGTRGAFTELFQIEEKDSSGNKVDKTTNEAEITNSTSVMMTTVSGNQDSIGYISLGSLNDTVKALKIDGVEPSVDNIKKGEYKISRSFNIAVTKNLSPSAEDFINYILSSDGQAVVEESGYISIGSKEKYKGTMPQGKITVAGSSSVTPVMEALKEAYLKVNPNAEIEIQQSDSTTGITSAIEGICDIGMASRELKDSEIKNGLTAMEIAMDGIAVIVNKNNSLEELTKNQVKDIFTGKSTLWSEISK